MDMIARYRVSSRVQIVRVLSSTRPALTLHWSRLRPPQGRPRAQPRRYAGRLLHHVAVACVFLAAAAPAMAQQYVVDEYTAASGLPNNLVKSVHQDETGFVWIGTDGGLVHFDGIALTSFTVADGLPSNYVKSVYADSRHRLFVITDQGIAQIVQARSEVRFRSVAAAGRVPSDSLLFYPKTMIEDRKGNLWVADARGVVRIAEDRLRRYTFPQASWPVSFVRSYTLVEDDLGHVLAFSERGSVFVFNSAEDQFVELDKPDELVQINAAILRKDGSIWVGGAYGLYSFRVARDHRVVDWRRVSELPNIMDLQALEDGGLVVGTSGSGLMTLVEDEGAVTVSPHAELRSNVIHDVMADKEGNIFAATDNGLSIVRNAFFLSAVQFRSTAIQSTVSSPSGDVYGIQETTFFRIDRSPDGLYERVPVFTAGEVLTSLATDGSNHWAATANGTVYLHRAGELRSFRLRSDQAVASIAVDGSGDAWMCHFSGDRIIRVATDGSTREYGPSEGVNTTVNVIRYLEGRIHAGGAGASYLLKYVPAEDNFTDVSQPIDDISSGGITVNDIDKGNDGTFWLATDQGLLAYGSGTVEKVYSAGDRLDAAEIRAITHDMFGHMWIGTGRGLYRYTAGQLARFTHDPGIANLTINYRSVVVDADQRVWVGHFGGVSTWNHSPGETRVTPQPILTRASVDGVETEADGGEIGVRFGGHVVADFVALSFPGHSIRYQTRVASDGIWSEPQPYGRVIFPKTNAGEYAAEVRAQQDGQMWSSPAVLRIAIALPWYRQAWAVVLFVILSLGLFALLWHIHDRVRVLQLKLRNDKLERLVTKRTKELSDQKRTIEKTNLELKQVLGRNHEFLGVAAHDLRNPLTSLIGFSELLLDSAGEMSPEEFVAKSADVLPIIHKAAATMQGVIQDLLDSQLVEREDNKLSVEETDFAQLARSVVNLNSVASRRKGITLTFNPQGTYTAFVDERSMQRVLDNLVSNAVKYSPPGSEVTIRLEHLGQSIRFSVIDRGPGLSTEDKSKVFGKLQRLSARPTGGEPSTGLGLYVARAVTELHGGSIGVNSIHGEGSEFWVEIPTMQVRAAA